MKTVKQQKEAKAKRTSVKDLEVGQCLRIGNKTVRIQNRYGDVFCLDMLQPTIEDGDKRISTKLKLDTSAFYNVIEGITDLFTATHIKIVNLQ